MAADYNDFRDPVRPSDNPEFQAAARAAYLQRMKNVADGWYAGGWRREKDPLAQILGQRDDPLTAQERAYEAATQAAEHRDLLDDELMRMELDRLQERVRRMAVHPVWRP